MFILYHALSFLSTKKHPLGYFFKPVFYSRSPQQISSLILFLGIDKLKTDGIKFMAKMFMLKMAKLKGELKKT